MGNKNNQHIKCNVHSCSYCNCDENVCKLKEIEIKKQSGCECAIEEDDTLCASYKIKKDIK